MCLVFLIFFFENWFLPEQKKNIYIYFNIVFNLVVLLFLFLIIRLLEYTLTLFFFIILELFKEAWDCGYNNNNNTEENSIDYQQVFDTDSSALCPH